MPGGRNISGPGHPFHLIKFPSKRGQTGSGDFKIV